MNYQSETDFPKTKLLGEVICIYCIIADQSLAKCIVVGFGFFLNFVS